MGLSEYKKFKQTQQLKEVLKEMGLNFDDLRTISLLKEELAVLKEKVALLEEHKVKNAEVEHKPIVVQKNNLTEDEKRKLKMIQDAKTKPEDFIAEFSKDIEEFYPNGKAN